MRDEHQLICKFKKDYNDLAVKFNCLEELSECLCRKIPGPPGPQGPPGEQGEQGLPGEVGSRGLMGTTPLESRNTIVVSIILTGTLMVVGSAVLEFHRIGTNVICIIEQQAIAVLLQEGTLTFVNGTGSNPDDFFVIPELFRPASAISNINPLALVQNPGDAIAENGPTFKVESNGKLTFSASILESLKNFTPGTLTFKTISLSWVANVLP